jgi:apolipoprotein N-acyltransferase
VLICYETIFPELAQARVERGSNLLVNISNDAWFGRSSAPRQHLDMSILRAVEQGRYLVRSTNTGISAAIDPKGRLLVTTGLYETARFNLPAVGLVGTDTVYHRLYPFIRPSAFILTGLLLALGAARGRPNRNPNM